MIQTSSSLTNVVHLATPNLDRWPRRAAIDRRLREVRDRHDPARGHGLIADVRAAFGVLAEGLPFDDLTDANTDEIGQTLAANGDPGPLVASLQPRGEGCPLFLIHAGGGYAFFYRALAARLAPNYPVYGIRAEMDTDNLGQPLSRCPSLEHLASRYIVHMRAIRPHGPYAVGGGSLGGVVAFEMARQLRAAGEQVRPVLMFSPELLRNVGSDDAGARSVEKLRQRVAFHWNATTKMPGAHAVRYVSSAVMRNASSEALVVLRRIRGHLGSKPPIGRDTPSAHTEKWEPLVPELAYRCTVNLRTGARLLMKYTPQPYPGPVVIFRATGDRDPVPHWTGVSLGGLKVHDTVGGHLDMLEEPDIRSNAAIVERYLE